MVKEPDQIRISDIPSSAVAYEIPICYRHGIPFVIYYTRRVVNQPDLSLTVIRKFHCPKCRAEGKISNQRSKQTRHFQNNSISKHSLSKVPKDEN